MNRSTRRLVVLAALSMAVFAAQAFAQRSFDDDQYDNPRDRYEHRFDQGSQREKNVAGEFDYYALVMSWSPTYCSDHSDGYDLQCDRTDGRRFAFVLHGLWPQYERGFPGECRTRRKPYVPQPVIDAMLDIMPSPKLVIHEYRKHGTCSGLEPAAYYETARQLFRKIKIPERYINPYEAMFVTPGEVVHDFIENNPDLKPEMLAVVCGGPGGRLREVRVCLTKEGQPRACGSNENQRKLCSAQQMFVPPVRSTKADPDSAEDRQKFKNAPTPRPRVIPGVGER